MINVLAKDVQQVLWNLIKKYTRSVKVIFSEKRIIVLNIISKAEFITLGSSPIVGWVQ